MLARAKAGIRTAIAIKYRYFMNAGEAGEGQIRSSDTLRPPGPLHMSAGAGGSNETEKFGYKINVVSFKPTG